MPAPDTLTKSRLSDGVWEAVLTLGREFASPPTVRALYRGRALDGLEMRPDDRPGRFVLRLELPVEVLSDGAHVIHFMDVDADRILATETILAGDTLAEDIRAEIELLRAELDMLKRAFRRHCVETM